MKHANLLDRKQSALILVDIQERILNVMAQPKMVVENSAKLIQGCTLYNIPVLYTEQYPKGLGPTVETLQSLLPGTAIQKMRFSVCRESSLIQPLREKNIKQIILCGIETHVCVQQSALDFVKLGFQVHVVADAVSSRSEFNYHNALERMRRHDVTITNTESVLFELAEVSGTDDFKKISKIIK